MMTPPPSPKLDLATLLATKAFDEEDIAHNRRGVMSPNQCAWRETYPGFMDEDDGDDAPVEALVGRVAIEGRHVLGEMGQTTFAKLVHAGRRFSLRPALKKKLLRDAPYRAYVAHGWVWSIEPITEEELRAATTATGTYRTSDDATIDTRIERDLHAALSLELGFDEADVDANSSGRFSPGQRAVGRKKLLGAVLGLVIATAACVGIVLVLATARVIPLFATVLGLAALVLGWLASVRAVADALARVVHAKPLRFVARLENDPANRDNVVLRIDDGPLRIKRAAFSIPSAPLSVLRSWRFEVYLVPWTRSIVAVRPVPPS
jgi:hypothetical protein